MALTRRAALGVLAGSSVAAATAAPAAAAGRSVAPVTLEGLEIFKAHVPFELTVWTPDIAAGFYRDLAGLQGHNRTYYNGAAFQSHNSSALWQFTETLLPEVAA